MASGLQRIILRDIAAKILRQVADQLEKEHPEEVTAIEWLQGKATEAERR